MMRILVLNPFAGVAQELERCRAVARPDTEIVFADIADVYPLNYVTYTYYTHRCADAVVQRVRGAEAEGFDAVFISCCYDPGLAEARELVDIPLTGAFEAGSHYASLISQRYSVIGTEPKTLHFYRKLAQFYGTDAKLASIRHIGISAAVSYPELTPPERIVERTLEVARQCIELDGAEAILMGCTLQSCPLTVSGTTEAAGAPIIDPVLVGLKMTEHLVDLRRVGLPTVSRFGAWQKPPAAEATRIAEMAATAERAIAQDVLPVAGRVGD